MDYNDATRTEVRSLTDTLQITLAAARVNAGMTQTDTAKALKVTKQTIVNWENGRIIPGAMQLDCLSRLYNIPVDNIFLPNKSTLSAFCRD